MIQALEQRANRYTKDRSYEEILDAKIDETRTIDGTRIQIEKQDNGNETNTNESIFNERMANNINKEKWKKNGSRRSEVGV